MIRPGLQPGISGSGGRRFIHWANGPCGKVPQGYITAGRKLLLILHDKSLVQLHFDIRLKMHTAKCTHGPTSAQARPHAHTKYIIVTKPCAEACAPRLLPQSLTSLECTHQTSPESPRHFAAFFGTLCLNVGALPPHKRGS